MSSPLDDALAAVGDARTVGELVRRRRQELGLSQSQFAIRVGMGQGDLSMLERGHKYAGPLAPTLLDRLSAAMAPDGKRGPFLLGMMLLCGWPKDLLSQIAGFDSAMIDEETAEELSCALAGAV